MGTLGREDFVVWPMVSLNHLRMYFVLGVSNSGISQVTQQLKITPKESETSSQDERGQMRGALNLTNAAEGSGIIRRSRSLPDICLDLHENSINKNLPTRWMGVIMWFLYEECLMQVGDQCLVLVYWRT